MIMIILYYKYNVKHCMFMLQGVMPIYNFLLKPLILCTRSHTKTNVTFSVNTPHLWSDTFAHKARCWGMCREEKKKKKEYVGADLDTISYWQRSNVVGGRNICGKWSDAFRCHFMETSTQDDVIGARHQRNTFIGWLTYLHHKCSLYPSYVALN